MDSDSPIEAPDAALGRADPTRRWAVAGRAGAPAFPGLTRGEARGAFAELAEEPGWEEYLVVISLPVLLSDGAGPYLIDIDGQLVLAVGDHPGFDGWRVAIGPLESGDEQVGVIQPFGSRSGVWRWCARARVGADHRLAALDSLDEVTDRAELSRWANDVEA